MRRASVELTDMVKEDGQVTHSSDTSHSGLTPTSGAGAFDDARVVTYLQPFYNLESGELQGVEALARLKDIDGSGFGSPAEFFEAAQAAGRMSEIDMHILDDALSEMRIQLDGGSPLIVSVNLSWDSVGRTGFDADILTALDRHGIPGYRLLLDITTDSFRRLLADKEKGLDRLRRLQEHEISFCLDGFTVADLDILDAAAEVPIDIITLHPSQVADDDGSAVRLTQLAAAVQNAGLPVVAAGVETAEQLSLVRELGFEWAQGFGIAKPHEASTAIADAPPRINF